MESEIIISFLVTYYNQEQYVRRSLDSILQQKMKYKYEILIGDDGSNDGTVEIINEYIRKFPGLITLFVLPRDHNEKYSSINRASSNRLNLLKNAKGRYFCFLDGDDYYCYEKFAQSAIEMLERNSSLSGCAFNFEYRWKNRRSENNVSISNDLLVAKDYLAYIYIHSGAFIFRKSEMLDISIFLDHKIPFDDNLITVFMLNYGDFYFIDKIAYSYTQNESGLWNSLNDIERSLLNALDMHYMFFLLPSFKKYIVKRQFNAIRVLYKNKYKLDKIFKNDVYLRYLDLLVDLNNWFVLDLLKWNNISLIQKIKSLAYYTFLKLLKGL